MTTTKITAGVMDPGIVDFSILENRIALLNLRHVIDLGLPIINAVDSVADEFHDNTGIIGGWLEDHANEAVSTIATGSSTSYVEVDGTEETAQSFRFSSTTPVIVAQVRLSGDNSTYPVDGDVFTLTIETDNAGAPCRVGGIGFSGCLERPDRKTDDAAFHHSVGVVHGVRAGPLADGTGQRAHRVPGGAGAHVLIPTDGIHPFEYRDTLRRQPLGLLLIGRWQRDRRRFRSRLKG